MFLEAISNTRKSVPSDIQTLQSWLKKLPTHFSVFGYQIRRSWISDKTILRVFHQISKCFKVGWKNSAAPRFSNPLLYVWISDKTLFLVFDILHSNHRILKGRIKGFICGSVPLFICIAGLVNEVNGTGYPSISIWTTEKKFSLLLSGDTGIDRKARAKWSVPSRAVWIFNLRSKFQCSAGGPGLRWNGSIAV